MIIRTTETSTTIRISSTRTAGIARTARTAIRTAGFIARSSQEVPGGPRTPRTPEFPSKCLVKS